MSVPLRALPLVAAQFACFVGVGATLPVLPVHVVDRLHASGAQLGLVLSAYPFAALVGRFIGGHASDRRGRRPTLMVGLVACSVAGFLLALPLDAPALAAVRILHGLGQAVVAVAAVTWLMDITEPERRAESLALIGAGVWGGTTLGTLAGGLLDSLWAVGLFAGVAALVGLPALRWTRRPPAVPGQKGRPTLIPREALVPGLTFGLGSAGYAAVIGFVVLHLNGRGASGTAALGVFSATVLVGRFVVVPVVVRYGLVRSLRPALVVTATGLVVLATAPGTAVAVIGAVLVAAGHSALWPALGAIGAGRVPVEKRGAAIGAMVAFYDVFVAVSSLLFALLATGPGAWTGTGRIFLVAAAVVLVAAAFDAAFGRSGRTAEGAVRQAAGAEAEPAP
ncbi:MAG: MFS transporter [Actinomycetota bacterium]|nr:MFS transporter [Actinomycetota bacterium]